MLKSVYLDNAATTAVDPRVLDAMLPFLTEKFGNASSVHRFGQEARTAVDEARRSAADLINAQPSEIVFTSGGTEANNLAIRGLAEAQAEHGRHIVTSNIEHPAVKEVCADLETRGFSLTVVPVGPDGAVSAQDVIGAVREDTLLVSLMLANNEIGTLQPVSEVGSFVRKRQVMGQRIFMHTDAVQAIGKMKVDVEELACDLLSMSAHKIHAPKGCGALYVKKGVRIRKQNLGGSQERKMRGGTENVSGIVAFGKACGIASNESESDASAMATLRDRFEAEVSKLIPQVTINGRGARLPNISNMVFNGVDGEAILINLDMNGIAVSTGSACSSGTIEASPVIRALGFDEQTARGAVRFSFGRLNSPEDLERLLEVLPPAIANLRSLK